MARIMVVGGDAQWRADLASTLAEEHAVRVASGAQQAARILSQDAVDVILLDAPADNGDWVAVLCAALAKDSSPRVIILSAFDDPVKASKVMRLGACDCIVKASNAQAVCDAVRAALEVYEPAEILAVG